MYYSNANKYKNRISKWVKCFLYSFTVRLYSVMYAYNCIAFYLVFKYISVESKTLKRDLL